MKRFFLGLTLAITSLGVFAQSVDKAKDLLKAKKLTDAKTEIDKVLAEPKGQKNAEAWYTKVKVYNAIAQDSNLHKTVPDAYQQSFEALKKYVDLDDKKSVSLAVDQFKPAIDVYQGFFQDGAAYYNAGQFNDAYTSFKNALASVDYIQGKGWITHKMDTISTLYAGISAEKSKNKDEAAKYYKILVDSNISKVSGNDVGDVYKWVADYYYNKADEANALKYLAIGQQHYPTDVFWADTKLDMIRKKGNKDSLFATYDEVIKQFPDNHLFFFNYGLELYQYASDTSSGKRPANADELVKRAQEMLNKSLQIKPDYPQAALVLGQISYNQGVDLQQQVKTVKGTKPEDIKKRTEIRQAMMKKFDEAIPYFEKIDQELGAQGKLKMEDKSALKDAYDLLISVYEAKNAKDKSEAYTTKFNNVDKVH